jgi:GTPase SAR1 family protein
VKTREEVIPLFREKYAYLKSVFPQVGPFNESQLYQNPDGGWQINPGPWPRAVITLRPGDDKPHETHGGICERWCQEGGAYNETKERGRLGYPVSDEEVYDGDGDSNGRVSHFENGDIVWTASRPDETRIVHKSAHKIAALNPRRREIIKPLEGLRILVKRPSNGLTDSRAKEMEQGIDAMERSIGYDRYRVTVFGAFSAGKSTLLNALMGANYLPSADLPTTNITTEIFRSDRFYVFMPTRHLTKSQIEGLRDEVSKEIPDGTFLEGLERDGQTIPGVGIGFRPGDSEGFHQITGQLASEQSRLKTGLSRFKKTIRDGQDAVLQLGIPELPEWLGEITLTDAPGAGSVYKGHESIIDDIIPKTQLVLYVVESPKAGSSVDEWLCNRIVNNYRRKVFFVLNKIDQQNDDEINDALAELKEHIPPTKAGSEGEPPPPKPEFLKCSALCETLANQLSDGSATIKDLTGNKKISISELLVSDEWKNAGNAEENRNLAIQFLRGQSHFAALRERIKSYLHEENKDLPFCEKTEVLLKTFGQELDAVTKTTIELLQQDTSEKSLQQEQQELRNHREQSAKEARSAVEDFRDSALRPERGVLSKVKGQLTAIPGAVAEKLDGILADGGEFKRLTKNEGEALKDWLTREMADQMEPIARKLDGELRRQGEHLVRRLRPILAKIDNATLAFRHNTVVNGIKEKPANDLEIGGNADKTVMAATVTAGVAGGALAAVLGLTVGLVTTTTTIAGTGLAGWLGTGTLASVAAWLGWGTAGEVLMNTAPFWGLGLGPIVAIVAVAVAALSIAAIPLAKSILRKKIVEKVRSALEEQIGGTEKDTIANQLKEKVDAFVNELADGCNRNLDSYLKSLDNQEKKILADVAKAKDDKEKKMKALTAFREEVKAFVESSVQSLIELNPGKEPVHG